jgi:hypothetical protein
MKNIKDNVTKAYTANKAIVLQRTSKLYFRLLFTT